MEVKISKKRKTVQVDEDGNSQSKKIFLVEIQSLVSLRKMRMMTISYKKVHPS